GFPFPEEKYKQKHHKGAIIRLKLDYNCLLIHKDNMRIFLLFANDECFMVANNKGQIKAK
ncbi:hypothetical protein WUBG_09051, partial [Wuchereria bancrofti]